MKGGPVADGDGEGGPDADADAERAVLMALEDELWQPGLRISPGVDELHVVGLET